MAMEEVQGEATRSGHSHSIIPHKQQQGNHNAITKQGVHSKKIIHTRKLYTLKKTSQFFDRYSESTKCLKFLVSRKYTLC